MYIRQACATAEQDEVSKIINQIETQDKLGIYFLHSRWCFSKGANGDGRLSEESGARQYTHAPKSLRQTFVDFPNA